MQTTTKMKLYSSLIFLVFIVGFFYLLTEEEITYVKQSDMKKQQLIKGDQLPSFKLKDQNNQLFSIDSIIGKKNIVIYFYPKDETKVCTAEACSFRDNYEQFQNLGCEVIGISSDNVESHKKFSENHNLPFILLSDEQNEVRKLFGVPNDLLGLIPGRYTYVIDKRGEIIHIFNSAFNADKHIEEALKALKKGK